MTAPGAARVDLTGYACCIGPAILGDKVPDSAPDDIVTLVPEDFAHRRIDFDKPEVAGDQCDSVDGVVEQGTELRFASSDLTLGGPGAEERPDGRDQYRGL